MNTILRQKIDRARQEGKTSLDLLKDPYDATEAVATLGINFSSPAKVEAFGGGHQQKTYETNIEGVTAMTTVKNKDRGGEVENFDLIISSTPGRTK